MIYVQNNYYLFFLQLTLDFTKVLKSPKMPLLDIYILAKLNLIKFMAANFKT